MKKWLIIIGLMLLSSSQVMAQPCPPNPETCILMRRVVFLITHGIPLPRMMPPLFQPNSVPRPRLVNHSSDDPSTFIKENPGITKKEVEDAIVIFCREHSDNKLCTKLEKLTREGRK